MRLAAALLTTAALLVTPALAARVTVPGTTLSLEVPPGFAPMTADVIALKYPRGVPPRLVYTTPDTRVNIAFELRDATLPAGQLKAFGAYMKAFIASNLRVLSWERNGLRALGGRDWYELAFTFQAADQPVYDRILITSEQGRALVVTANATVTALPQHRGALDAALNSIRF